MLTVIGELAARWESFKDERGASMVEYALLVVMIAIIAIAGVLNLRRRSGLLRPSAKSAAPLGTP